MSKAQVLVTAMQLSDQVQKILRDADLDMVFIPEPTTEDEFAAALKAANPVAVLMRGNPPLTQWVLQAAPQLKIIAKHGAGIDSIDLPAAAERGIAVTTAGGANADAVAELSLALMLAVARELPRLDRGMKAGAWERPQFEGREFRGRTVGIVGFGEIGRRVARLATAFGAKVVLHSRSTIAPPEGAEVETCFETLLKRVDILSLHCPLTPETRGMLGARQLRLLRPGAILINTARGALIDEAALIEALTSGALAGAGLDTFAIEPPDPKHPLLALDNVISTPHIGGSTQESLLRTGTVAAASIVRHLREAD